MNFRSSATFGYLIALLLMITSCASNKKILYLQDAGAMNSAVQSYANVIEPDDNVMITITSDVPALAMPFNNTYLSMQSTDVRNSTNPELQGYLIDESGEIDFPILGKIKLAGLTRVEAEDKIKVLLKPHIVNAGVNLRVLNFKVSVLGEVKNPGAFPIKGDRFTILEALGAAGDLTIYGNRSEIMIIREEKGVRSINEVDITSTDFINSPYYYLSHNDVVYVKPNKTKVNSSVVGPNLTVGISAISLLITIITLSTR